VSFVRYIVIVKKNLFENSIILISLLQLLPLSLSGFDKTGTTGAVFLKIGMGGRASSLAGAYVPLADDPSACYWNPGGIGFIKENTLEAGYNKWFVGIKQGYAYFVLPFGRFYSLGLGVNSLTSGKIGVTTIEEPEGNGLFYSYRATVISLSLARLLSSSFSFGVSLKAIQEVLWREVGGTFAVDFGILYYTEFKGLSIGLSLSNIGGRMHLDGPDLEVPVEVPGAPEGHPDIEGVLKTEHWALPVVFRAGISQEILGPDGILAKSESMRAKFIFQATHYAEAKEDISLGIEVENLPWVALRGGWKIWADEETWSCGLGIGLPWGREWIRLDYALTNMGRLDLIHRVSLLRSF